MRVSITSRYNGAARHAWFAVGNLYCNCAATASNDSVRNTAHNHVWGCSNLEAGWRDLRPDRGYTART